MMEVLKRESESLRRALTQYKQTTPPCLVLSPCLLITHHHDNYHQYYISRTPILSVNLSGPTGTAVTPNSLSDEVQFAGAREGAGGRVNGSRK